MGEDEKLLKSIDRLLSTDSKQFWAYSSPTVMKVYPRGVASKVQYRAP